MDIKVASDTPTLVAKILGSNNFSSAETGSKENQTVNIDNSSSSYTDNSTITVTNIETYYSDLGLLNSPIITTDSEELNILKTVNDISHKAFSSILETNSELNDLYYDISIMLEKSDASSDFISRETYLLLAVQSLVNCTFAVSNTLFLTIDNINTMENYSYINKILYNIFSINVSISTVEKSLNVLIGQSSLTFNYAEGISKELFSCLDFIDIIINDLLPDSMLENKSVSIIIDSIQVCKKSINVTENNIPLFTNYIDSVSKILNSLDLILDGLILSLSSTSDVTLTNFIYSAKNNVKLIYHTVSAISMSYSNIEDNYYLIISNIKSASSYLYSISNVTNNLHLTNKYDADFILSKTYSKIFENKNAQENLKLTQDLTPHLNIIYNDSEIEKVELTNANNIKNSSLDTDVLNNTPSENQLTSASSEIIKNITLELSFYVCNLNIVASGTIGSENFTGHIYYPNLTNLSYFSINSITVNIDVVISEYTNTFNINQCLNPKLEVTSITPLAPYTLLTPHSFDANMELSFTLNGEVLITAAVPIVIAK